MDGISYDESNDERNKGVHNLSFMIEITEHSRSGPGDRRPRTPPFPCTESRGCV